MPLPAWAPFAISAGTQALGGLFGGKKQTTSYEMSPEARRLYEMYMGQLGEGTPSYLTDPINRMFGARARQTREGIGGGLGPGSGLEMGQLRRLTAEKGRTLGNVGQQHQEMLMRQLAGLVAPPSQTTEQPQNWGETIGNIGGDYLAWQGFQDYMDKFGRVEQTPQGAPQPQSSGYAKMSGRGGGGLGSLSSMASRLGSAMKSGPGSWGVGNVQALFDLLKSLLGQGQYNNPRGPV